MNVSGMLEKLQELACQDRVTRILHTLLGPPQSEEENYAALAAALISKFKGVLAPPLQAEHLEGFIEAVNCSSPSEEGEEEELLSRPTLTTLHQTISNLLLADVNHNVEEGMKVLMEEERKKELEAAKREVLRSMIDTTQTLAQRRAALPITTEEKLHVAQMVRGGIEDEAVLMSMRDENEERPFDVELKEVIPPFLRDYTWRNSTVYGKPVRLRDDNEEKKNSLELAALKQQQLDHDRRVLRQRERRKRMGATDVGDLGIAAQSQGLLGRDIDEPVEERGIRSKEDLPERLPPWMRQAAVSGSILFGKRSLLPLQEQRRRLPIFARREDILNHIDSHQTTVLQGETGSGKTSQIPQYLLEHGYGRTGIIGCTQPRRVAAVTLAERVAEERGGIVGDEVGYSVRFKEMTSSNTKIKYMTDGMLLREALLDDTFQRYSVIILDEAHVRSICTDVLFGIMKNAVRKRPNLKLIVTSATLNMGRFCEFFEAKDPFLIEGRTFPVSHHYLTENVEDYVAYAVRLVMTIHLEKPPGDILVFFAGQDEIETASEKLFEFMQGLPEAPELIILQMYATLPNEIQSKVFEPTPPLARKVVLATNVAETSITIDNLFYVIDPGFCKQNIYDPKTGTEELKIVPVSRAEADQRAGRAGRIGPGECYRLYSEDAYKYEMLPAPVPEIQRTNLANVVLTLKAVGIDNLLSFEFMDPPPKETLVNALERLHFLGALDDRGALTVLGKRMSELPLEPSQSKTLLTAVDLGCAPAVLTIVSMLAQRNVFYRPRDKQEEADRRKLIFNQPEGDQLTLMEVYDRWVEAGMDQRWSQAHYINHRAMRDAHETRDQLVQILAKHRSFVPDAPTRDVGFVAVRKALTAGYFFQVAKRKHTGSYSLLADKREIAIHPSSTLYETKPRYVIYHELVMTSREFMRQAMAIDPRWLVELAPAYYKEGRAANERLDPTLRYWEKGNDWRISKLKRRK